MNETSVRQKVFRLLKKLDEIPITQTDANRCPNCGSMTKPPIGRPDILGTPKFVIEVKVLSVNETSFPFSKISDKQRKWLNFWSIKRRLPGFIALGVIRPHGSREYLENLYLVPWENWLEVEDTLKVYQNSIPYEAGKGYKKELQEQSLDIVTLLSEYEVYRKNKEWVVPNFILTQIIGGE